MESKLTGVGSWLLAGLTASVVAVPLSWGAIENNFQSTSWSTALSTEELRTAYASTRATPNRQRTVQVGPRDTLWSIARSTRPNNSITIKQAMLAIRDANPTAFPTGNINEMEMGVRLVIPSNKAMTSRSAMQAEQEVRRQNQAWVASRAPAAPTAKKAPAQTQQPKVTSPPKPKAEPAQKPLDLPASTPRQRDLTLSTPKANEAQQKRINQLEEDLSVSEESLQTVEREKDELAERISDMQQQVSTLQQLIQLKDQQLADMEEQLVLEQAQPGASRTIVPKASEPQDLASKIKRQPELYGALAAATLLLLILFFALLSARKKLKAARQQAKQEQTPSEVLNTAFAEDQASSKDFDLDLNAQPLNGLEELDELEGLEELESLDFDDELSLNDNLDDTSFDLDNLEDELLSVAETNASETKPTTEKKPADALEEAETFIAYGRLEQAAGFLKTALEENPKREDLRIKLLEVLVELNDEETFLDQQQQLAANSASTAGLERAAELANFFAAAKTDLNMIAADLDTDDLDDLDTLFPDTEMTNLVDDSTDDLADLDSLETDLDTLIASKEPWAPSPEETLEGDDFDLEELDASGLESLKLDLEDDLEDDLDTNLEKPLDATELADQSDSSTGFEPVDYKSDADDFMEALDSLTLDSNHEMPASQTETQDPQQAPGVDEELAALNENLAELEAISDNDNIDDLSDLDELEGFGDLADLSDLGDQDLGLDDIEGGMTTQLDLATAYIEMGDKEGAREILEKVAKEGDADLKATALQMLETLSN